MSQVEPMPKDMAPTLNEVTTEAQHIVELEDLKAAKIYYKKVFPKKTHYLKKNESTYVEHIYSYKVQKVLKSKTLKVGDKIWIKLDVAYDEAAIKATHELGISESPFIEVYYSQFPQKDRTENSFFFLRDIVSPKHKDVYNNTYDAREGLKAEAEIQKILQE